MGLITVNPELCKKDEFCKLACPISIIDMTGPDGLPELVPGGEELCISCGHCVAVCPFAALDHAAMTAAECPELPKEWPPAPDEVERILRSRRSIRNYKPAEVDRDKLERLIRVATHAPTGHNTQSLSISVYSGVDRLRELAKAVVGWMRYIMKEMPALAEELHMDLVVDSELAGDDRIMRGAPHVVVIHTPKEFRQGPTSAVNTAAYMELMAPSLGLGTCWAGYFNAAAQTFPPMQQALGLPEGHKVWASILVGEPKLKYRRLPKRNAPDIAWK